MALSKDRITKLIKRAEELHIEVQDFTKDIEAYDDGFFQGFFSNLSKEQCMQLAIDNDIHNITDLLEYVGKRIWSEHSRK